MDPAVNQEIHATVLSRKQPIRKENEFRESIQKLDGRKTSLLTVRKSRDIL